MIPRSLCLSRSRSSLSFLGCSWMPIVRDLHESRKLSGPERVAAHLTKSFSEYPVESVICLLGTEIVSIYGTHALLEAGAFNIPAEFAVAFALGRTLRRVRLPVEVAVAIGMCKVFPILSQVKVTGLFNAIPASIRNWFSSNKSERSERVVQFLDKYGIAYLLSARLVGVVGVCTIFSCLRVGFDVAPIFQALGISEYGSVLGTWAASVSLSSALYPLTLLAAGYLAPRIHRLRRAIFKPPR